MRKTVLILCTTVLCLGISSKSQAETWNCGEKNDAGEYSSNVKCTLDENGIFTVSGEGKMADFPYEAPQGKHPYSMAPWGGSVAAMNKIKQVIVGDKITRIGSYAFMGGQQITAVEIPNVKSIGIQAFRDAYHLNSIRGANVEELEFAAFSWSMALRNVYMPKVRTINNAFPNDWLTYAEIGSDTTIIGTLGGLAQYCNRDVCAKCGNNFILKGVGCVSKCPANYKENDGWCDRVRYTPAEAAAIAKDDGNVVTLTFKKQ